MTLLGDACDVSGSRMTAGVKTASAAEQTKSCKWRGGQKRMKETTGWREVGKRGDRRQTAGCRETTQATTRPGSLGEAGYTETRSNSKEVEKKERKNEAKKQTSRMDGGDDETLAKAKEPLACLAPAKTAGLFSYFSGPLFFPLVVSSFLLCGGRFLVVLSGRSSMFRWSDLCRPLRRTKKARSSSYL